MRLRFLYTPVAIGCFALIVLSGCTAVVDANQTSSPFPQMEGGSQLSSEEISEAFATKQAIDCTIHKDETTKIRALIQGQNSLLTNIRLRQGAATGMVLVYNSEIYAWKDGASQGWKMLLPPREQIPELLERLHNIGVDVPNVTSSESLTNITTQGFQVTCEKTQVDDHTFAPRDSVHYTDVSDGLVKSLSILQ